MLNLMSISLHVFAVAGHLFMSSSQPIVCKSRTTPQKSALTKVEADKILKSFNTWAYKREQPTEPELLRRVITAAAAKSEPINFVLYWGKGFRSSVAEPELICLDYLKQMADRIQNSYRPGATITLVATDTHAEHNGHCASSIANYFSEVENAASERDFSFATLKSIVERERERIALPATKPSAEMLAKLEPCAAKWYRGGNTIVNGAEQYYQMNMLEKRAVELSYPHSIFITFNGAEYRDLFPDSLPAFYMYSMRKGTSVKPWFTDVKDGNEVERREPNSSIGIQTNFPAAEEPRTAPVAASRNTSTDYPRVLACGDSGMSIEFGDRIDAQLNARVIALDAALSRSKPDGLVETVPTYRSLLIHYDPVITHYAKLANEVLALVGDDASVPLAGRLITIPVCYDQELGVDLTTVSDVLGLLPEEIIARHVAPEYRVYMLGFQPGFAYLGGLDPRLSIPRLRTPRPGARAGTISIASDQCAVHAVEGPSGWHWIGRTPLRTYVGGAAPSFALEPGDRVRFTAITPKEWRERDRAARAGESILEVSS